MEQNGSALLSTLKPSIQQKEADTMDIRFSVERMVMQPTSLCNLNCSYCYLSDRDKNRKMSAVVAERVAQGIAELGNAVEIVWHGGEPLSCGINYFTKLMFPLEQLRRQELVRHAVQTNATLINERWCEFFKFHQFRVGVSIDGPAWANSKRIGWNCQPAFDKIMRGICFLREAEIPFSVICVVSDSILDKAKELYDFFVELGCASFGVNIEEQLGVHTVTINSKDYGSRVTQFWRELFAAWRENPVIKVREFARMLPSLLAFTDGKTRPPKVYDVFPSIAWNGDVVLLAPEFLNTIAPRYDNFVVGNILNDGLHAIIESGKKAAYVRDFIQGVNRCREECEYFSLCYGGQAGNKFFEYGTTNVTETEFCRNSEKRLADAILQELESVNQ